MTSLHPQAVYRRRFAPDRADRHELWTTLARHWFQRYVPPSATVLDVAAGHCELLNALRCHRRIALDLNPDVVAWAGPGVEAVVARADALDRVVAGPVDVAIASNVFEHLADAAELLRTLGAIHAVLVPHGRLLVLQPNLRLTGAAYWDFLDHSLPITDRRLVEALELSGFEIEELIVRFLPYTTESRLPVAAPLIRAYLRCRPAWRLLGRQTFVVARPRSLGGGRP